jgi:pimeloyl-ACP methyl ester carboxylesterase
MKSRTVIAIILLAYLIPGAGHLAELDKPDEVAAAILGWTA